MLIVAYDISETPLRTRFAEFLKKFGYRLQYSVFQIQNSKRILDLIQTQIETDFSQSFTQSDSIIIFNLSEQCKIKRFGYAANDDSDLIMIT